MPDQEVRDVAGITVHEHVSVVKRIGDRVVGFVETERQSVARSGAHLVEGKIHTQLTGASPQNEADSLIVAAILVKKLNSLETQWCAPMLTSEPADCEAMHTTSSGRSLLIQVIRPNLTSAFWRELNVTGNVEVHSDATELVAAVEAAIEKKAAQYSPTDRGRLLLALDANRLPALVLDSVRERVVAMLAPVASRSGFAAMWVVGPTPETTYALLA